MKTWLPVLSILMVLSRPMFARIGETAEQIQQRYGAAVETKVTDAKETEQTYSANGFQIVVYFLDGKSQAELFVKRGDPSPDLSENEVQTLLDANNFGLAWQPFTDSTAVGKDEWTLSTKPQLFAIHSKYDFPPSLIIFTETIHEKAASDAAAGEKKNLSGF